MASWEEWATNIARREVRFLQDRCRDEIASLNTKVAVLEGDMRRVAALEESSQSLAERITLLEERLEGLDDAVDMFSRMRLPLRVSALEIALDANTRSRQEDDPSSQSLAERIALLETQFGKLGLSPVQQFAGSPPAGPAHPPPAPSAPPPPAGPPPPPRPQPSAQSAGNDLVTAEGLILMPFMRVPPTPEPDQGRCDHFHPEWFVQPYTAGCDEFKGAKDIGLDEDDTQSNKLWSMCAKAATMWDLAWHKNNPQLYNVLKDRPTLEIDNHNPGSGAYYVRLGCLRRMKMTVCYQPQYINSAHGLECKYKDMKAEPKIRQAMRCFIAEVTGCDKTPSLCRFRLGESDAFPLAIGDGDAQMSPEPSGSQPLS